MTPLGHGQLAQWMRSSRSLRAAEVCLITLSNDAVSYIAWRYHLDLYVVLAVTLYLYIGARYLRHLHLDFHLSYSRVGISAAVGAGLAVPAIIFIAHPVMTSSVSYAPIKLLSVESLLNRLLVPIPVLTAIIEELVFRQYLFRQMRSLPRTLVLNAVLFTAWHLVATLTSVRDTSLGQSAILSAVSYVGALASVFVSGLVFALIRAKTGSFLYSAIAHWLSVALLTLALWLF